MCTKLSVQQRLELFGQRVLELYERRLVQGGMNTQLTLRWSAATQLLTQEVLEPDEEDLRSFLLIFRQFVSEKEPVFVGRVFNDCLRYLDSSRFKEELAKAQVEWKRVLHRMGAFNLTIDERHISGEYVLDLWLNGHYFHSDSEKAAELHRYVASDALPIVRMQFLSIISDLTQIIFYVGSVVNYGLREGLFRVNDVGSVS